MKEGRVLRRPDSGLYLLLFAATLAAMVTQGALGQATFSQANSAAPTAGDAAAQLPAFDVVSVKPNRSGLGPMSMMFTPDGVSDTNVVLQMILRETFGVQDDRILGAPGWVKTDRFDIEAKVEASDAPRLKDFKFDQRWKMLLPVLADRFNLKFHHESREMPTYALVIAKGGLKLKEANPGDTYHNGLKGPNGAVGAGGVQTRPGEIRGQGVPIAVLLNSLGLQGMDRTIFDKTGLTGKYDFTLTWTPDEAAPAMAGVPDGGSPRGDAATAADTGPSLFTALEEQLGLKLEPQKSPVDVIVIDHIERPSEN